MDSGAPSAGTGGDPGQVGAIIRDSASRRAEWLLGAMPVGFILWDLEWRCIAVNVEGERLSGHSAEQLLGGELWTLFPDVVGTNFETVYRRVAESGSSEALEIYYPQPVNRWLSIQVSGDEAGVAAYFIDVTSRHETEELLRLTLEFGDQLVGAAVVDDAVLLMAQSVVPRLADWAIVSLVEPDGEFRDVCCVHADPMLQPWLEQYMSTRMDNNATIVATRVAETGEPVIITSGVTPIAFDMAGADATREALIQLATESVVTAPLKTDSTVAGVLTLGRRPNRPAASAQDVTAILGMARRAGLAIENIRLNAERERAAAHDSTVARALHEALLTRLPELPGLDVQARYLSAADQDRVGGDWYDALAHASGAVTITIGDVMGHDIAAAGTMGQLRGALRTLAWVGGLAPSALLGQLDRAAHDMGIDTMATVLTAQLSVSSSDGPAQPRIVRWSSAGHPPPIALHADGRSEILPRSRRLNDPPIGVVRSAQRHDHEYALRLAARCSSSPTA